MSRMYFKPDGSLDSACPAAFMTDPFFVSSMADRVFFSLQDRMSVGRNVPMQPVLVNDEVYYPRFREYPSADALVVSDDDASSDDTSENRHYCNQCSTLCTRFCARCQVAYYCSNYCQRYDWDIHRFTCGIVPVDIQMKDTIMPLIKTCASSCQSADDELQLTRDQIKNTVRALHWHQLAFRSNALFVLCKARHVLGVRIVLRYRHLSEKPQLLGGARCPYFACRFHGDIVELLRANGIKMRRPHEHDYMIPYAPAEIDIFHQHMKTCWPTSKGEHFTLLRAARSHRAADCCRVTADNPGMTPWLFREHLRAAVEVGMVDKTSIGDFKKRADEQTFPQSDIPRATIHDYVLGIHTGHMNVVIRRATFWNTIYNVLHIPDAVCAVILLFYTHF